VSQSKNQEKHKFNFLRKGWHLLGLIIPLAVYFDFFGGFLGYEHATRAIIVLVLVFSLFFLILVEIARFRSPGFSKIFWLVFGPLMKDGEREYMNATIPYFAANLVVILIFPPEISVLSLGFLVFGDPMAAYVGSNYGKHRFSNGKSWEGIIAFSFASLIFGVLALWALQSQSSNSGFEIYRRDTGVDWLVVILVCIGGLVAALTEFLSGTSWKGFLDDNLLIPIVSGFAMALACILFLGFSWEQVIFPIDQLFRKIP
jgi:dolichol kinase